MIIEIRQQGKKKKYYLSHSFRDENKVKKKELNKIKKNKKISWK